MYFKLNYSTLYKFNKFYIVISLRLLFFHAITMINQPAINSANAYQTKLYQ